MKGTFTTTPPPEFLKKDGIRISLISKAPQNFSKNAELSERERKRERERESERERV
jgi:hypothetical protein